MSPALRTAALAVAGTAAAGALTVGYAVGVERRWYTLRQQTVPVLRPSAAGPLRVLHLSDLHLQAGQQHRLDFVRRCLESAPDLVVATGDFLESGDAIDDVVEVMEDAARGRVALAVLGSHDRWGPRFRNPIGYLTAKERRVYGQRLDTSRLVAGLHAGGTEVLVNRRVAVDTPVGVIDVIGLDDPHVGLDRPEAVSWAPPEDDVALRLGLVHAPYLDPLERFARGDIDLALAGHTHGGQLRVPLYGALVNNCDLPLPQSRGLSRHGDAMWLHVSAGLGHSRYAPFRFCCRPEATILDLVPRLA